MIVNGSAKLRGVIKAADHTDGGYLRQWPLPTLRRAFLKHFLTHNQALRCTRRRL